MQEKSLEMARQLEKLDVGKHPIVWAAHSKGGLFVKQMFINCNSFTLVFYVCISISNNKTLKITLLNYF